MNIIKWIDYARKNIEICRQIKAIKDIRTIMREV